MRRQKYMDSSAEQILDYFDRLPDPEKRKVVAEIMRRSIRLDLPSLTDEELTLSAEDVFLALDRRESPNEGS
jgi:hypothetical protein